MNIQERMFQALEKQNEELKNSNIRHNKLFTVCLVVLSLLLILSVGGNIYQSTLTCEYEINQIIDNNSNDNNMENTNGE